MVGIVSIRYHGSISKFLHADRVHINVFCKSAIFAQRCINAKGNVISIINFINFIRILSLAEVFKCNFSFS